VTRKCDGFSVVNGKCGRLRLPSDLNSIGGRKVFNFVGHKLTRKGIRQKGEVFPGGFSPDVPHCRAAVAVEEAASLDTAHRRCSRTGLCPRVSTRNTNEPEN
jgi:hypothetical protein